jgi:hypothetical protein
MFPTNLNTVVAKGIAAQNYRTSTLAGDVTEAAVEESLLPYARRKKSRRSKRK